MFQIEKNIPAPEAGARNTKYPFRSMAVGDSFLVPASEAGWRSANRAGGGFVSNVQRSASLAGKRMGRRFTCRRLPDRSVRVWRVA